MINDTVLPGQASKYALRYLAPSSSLRNPVGADGNAEVHTSSPCSPIATSLSERRIYDRTTLRISERTHLLAHRHRLTIIAIDLRRHAEPGAL